MGLELEYDYGQTPLDEDEKEGLLISSIMTREDLNEFEQNNIESAVQWTLGLKLSEKKILSETFIKKLHQEMFGEVWKWAGSFRRTNKNLGVDKNTIAVELKKLLDDAYYWLENKTFHPDEFAIRIKHRVVSIHLFPNGNGRHSRLLADVIVSRIFKKDVFTWGSLQTQDNSASIRKQYIDSLRKADSGEYDELIRFARS